MSQISNNLRQIESLVEIVSRLRGPEGCPWDREQTHESLTQYAIEETHELVEALEQPSHPTKDQNIKEELGDVLFQVVLHSQLASERGAFTLADVIEGVSKKMLYRHLHVFGDTKGTATKIRTDLALDIPAMPALQRAYKIGKRTEKLYFDWDTAAEAMVKVEEELGELREALDNDIRDEIELELGDVLFSLSQLARHLKMEPEQVLRKANRKFETRFNKMIEIAKSEGVDWSALDLDGKDVYWQKAKAFLKRTS